MMVAFLKIQVIVFVAVMSRAQIIIDYTSIALPADCFAVNGA